MYRRYTRLRRDAMRSIGKFEEYGPAPYWDSLLTKCGFRIVASKMIAWRAHVPPSVLEKLVLDIIRE